MLHWMTSLFSRQLNWTQLLFLPTYGTMFSYPLLMEKRTVKVKVEVKGRARPLCLPVEDRRQRPGELKAKTECRACGRKGHWAHDRGCAMFPFSLSSKSQTHTARMTTQLHLSNQPKKVTTCCVLNDCSDDSETPANIAGQNVPLPAESTGQTLLTPIASTASTAAGTRTVSVFGVCALDSDDEPWLSETDYKSGWNKTRRWNVPWYLALSFSVGLSEKGRVIDQGRKRAGKYA